MSEQKFPEGIFFNIPHPNAPDFVKGSVKIDILKFGKWLSALYKQGETTITLDCKVSGKTGKGYCSINDWKPDAETDETEADEDIPF